MKKLVFAFTLSIMMTAVASETKKEAQAYDVAVTVKTTAAKKAKLTTKTNPFIAGDGQIVYRVQSTQKWKGLIWGCECEALSGKWAVVDDSSGSVSGCVIWNNSKPNNIIYIGDINWRLLNAIDKKGDKCEGSWTCGTMDEESDAFLCFAGFGTLMVKYDVAPCEDPELNCASYVKSMSGNVSGWMPAPAITTAGKPGNCIFCGESEEGTEDSTDASEAWNFCPCEDFADTDFSAVSGTWSIKYNKTLSSKLMNSSSIADVYKFPESVKTQVIRKENELR